MQKATKENNYLYNPNLKERARKLRRSGTKAEAYLWKFVLSKTSQGHQFLRQRPVLNYIADFMCPDLLLIIEVDGITHLDIETQRNDKIRQDKLEKAGFTVLRFADEAILNNLSMVSTVVAQEIEKLVKA